MSTFKTLVLCGGGIKGLLILGALQYALDQFLLKEVTKFVGTSIGSIISYLLAIGYTPIEIMVYLCTTKIDGLKFFDILAMTNGKGAMSYTNIQEHLEKMTIEKIGKFLTLSELKSKYGKELVCTTYNLTDCKIEYLSPDTFPEMPCLTALRLSSNLPFVFEKYKYMGKYYIDGGIVDDFPIRVADNNEDNVFGIVIFSTSNFENTNNFLDYAYSIINVPRTELSNLVIKSVSDKCKILRIKNKANIKPFEFSISSSTKLNMFSKGYKKAKKFFETKTEPQTEES